MSYAAIIFGTAALVCGLIAATQWYRASKIAVVPNFSELPEDVGETDFNWALIKAIMIAARETSSLNRLAALWTAAAVLLGAATSLLTTLTLH